MHMKWKTEINIPKASPWKLSDSFFFMGSCFAENMFQRMHSYDLQVKYSPFGISFNPLSLAKQLNTLENLNRYQIEESLINRSGAWFSYDFHSKIYAEKKEDLLQLLKQRLTLANEQLNSAKVLVLTLGSAYYYEHEHIGLVNNCHKQHAGLLTKKIARAQEIVEALNAPLLNWLAKDPEREVVLTVSPVRHWKDGGIANNHSKSQLIVACHDLIHQDNRISYFPAYEILMDELRDYRFYADDLLHPSQTAIQYIWEKWVAQRFSQHMTLFKQLDKIIAGIKHQPVVSVANQHQEYINSLSNQLAMLAEEHQHNFPNIQSHIKQKLHE